MFKNARICKCFSFQCQIYLLTSLDFGLLVKLRKGCWKTSLCGWPETTSPRFTQHFSPQGHSTVCHPQLHPKLRWKHVCNYLTNTGDFAEVIYPNAKYCFSTWTSCWISNGPCFNNSSRCFQNQLGPLKSQALQNYNTFPLGPLTHCKKLWLERVCFKDVASEKSSPQKNSFALEKFGTGPRTRIFLSPKKTQRTLWHVSLSLLPAKRTRWRSRCLGRSPWPCLCFAVPKLSVSIGISLRIGTPRALAAGVPGFTLWRSCNAHCWSLLWHLLWTQWARGHGPYWGKDDAVSPPNFSFWAHGRPRNVQS